MRIINKLFELWVLICLLLLCSCDDQNNKQKDDNQEIMGYLECAEKTANWLISKAYTVSEGIYKWPVAEELSNSYVDCNMGSGTVGIGVFFLEMYKITNNATYLKYAEGAGKLVAQYDYQDEEIDWLSGAAGTGCYLIELWKVAQNELYLTGAKKAGDWLIEKHYEGNGGYYWKHYPDFPKIYTSWAHGAAGIGAFFAKLYDATGDERYLDYAKGASRWIDSYKWESSPGLYSWPKLTTDTEPNTTWCGGSVGIILFYLQLYDTTKDSLYLNFAVGGADWLVKVAKRDSYGNYKWGYTGSDNTDAFAYCHGTPSVVHILYEMYKRTGKQDYLNYAKGGAKWLQVHAENLGENKYRWPHLAGLPHDTGLLTGTAGVGNAFISYYSFEVDSSYLDYAKGAANWLISISEKPADDQVYWINYVDAYDPNWDEKLHKTGWYSGAAGIGIFFLNLSQIVPNNKCQ